MGWAAFQATARLRRVGHGACARAVAGAAAILVKALVPAIAKGLRRIIALLSKELVQLEAAISEHIKTHPDLAAEWNFPGDFLNQAYGFPLMDAARNPVDTH